MKHSVRKQIILILLLFSVSVNSQGIKLGAWGQKPLDQIRALDFNSVLARARTPLDDISNLSDLKVFDNIFALNNSATPGGLPGYVGEAYDPFYHLTGAAYNRFFPATTGDYTNQRAHLFRPAWAAITQHNGKTVLSSGTNETHAGEYMITGPDYFQSAYWLLPEKSVETPAIYYISFHLILGQELPPTDDNLQANVAEVAVVCTLKNNAANLQIIFTLHTSVLSAAQINANTLIGYNYNSVDIYLKSLSAAERATCEYKTSYLVKWLGNYELMCESIEVWDDIWDDKVIKRFSVFYEQCSTYVSLFSGSTVFYNGLRGWQGLNEPHSMDNLYPFHFVDSLCKVLAGPDKGMFTQFYPEWNNVLANGNNPTDFMRQIISIAKPDPLFFWYYPFNAGHTDVTGLYLLQTNALEPAFTHLSNPEVNAYPGKTDFYYTAQAWGWTELENPNTWVRWRQPSGRALRGSIFLAMAYGARGIFIEPLNTYTSTYGGTLYTTHGILTVSNELNSLGTYTRDHITPRLMRALGTEFTKLKLKAGQQVPTVMTLANEVFPNNFTAPGNALTDENESVALDITEAYNNGLLYPAYFVAASLENKTAYDPGVITFLMNLQTDAASAGIIKVRFKNAWGRVYNEYYARNLESRVDMRIELNTPYNLSIESGDGVLLKVLPVIKGGGIMTINDVITGNDTLRDSALTISSGVTLTVQGNYIITENIIINSNAHLMVSGRIVSTNGARIICNGGYVEFVGTITDKATAEFEGGETAGSIIGTPFAGLTINHALITGAKEGIRADYFTGSAFINNSWFANCGTAVSINGFGLNWIPLFIENNLIQNCTVALQVTASNEVVVKNNIINNCGAGLFMSYVLFPYIIHNTISSTAQTGSGMELVNTNGVIRRNTITGFSTGMQLGYSSPDLYLNTITGAARQGVVIGAGSYPRFTPMQIDHEGYSVYYNTAGENTITNNGNRSGGSAEEGAEVYFNYGTADFQYGRNNITDDRGELPGITSRQYLFAGTAGEQVKIALNEFGINPYGHHGRFGGVDAYNDGTDPFDGYADSSYVLSTSNQYAIDTITCAGVDNYGGWGGYAPLSLSYYGGNFASAAAGLQASPGQAGGLQESGLLTIAALLGNTLLCDSLGLAFGALADSAAELAAYYTNLQAQAGLQQDNYAGALGIIQDQVQQAGNEENAYFAAVSLATAESIAEAQGGMGSNALVTPETMQALPEQFSRTITALLKTKYGLMQPGKVTANTTPVPAAFTVSDNYPNPFNPETRISYTLPQQGMVTAEVYSLLGERVAVLAKGEQRAGSYTVSFNGAALPSGVYIYRVSYLGKQISKKMLMVK